MKTTYRGDNYHKNYAIHGHLNNHTIVLSLLFNGYPHILTICLQHMIIMFNLIFCWSDECKGRLVVVASISDNSLFRSLLQEKRLRLLLPSLNMSFIQSSATLVSSRSVEYICLSNKIVGMQFKYEPALLQFILLFISYNFMSSYSN
jgi:hypothetical protein